MPAIEFDKVTPKSENDSGWRAFLVGEALQTHPPARLGWVSVPHPENKPLMLLATEALAADGIPVEVRMQNTHASIFAPEQYRPLFDQVWLIDQTTRGNHFDPEAVSRAIYNPSGPLNTCSDKGRGQLEASLWWAVLDSATAELEDTTRMDSPALEAKKRTAQERISILREQYKYDPISIEAKIAIVRRQASILGYQPTLQFHAD